MNIQPLLRSLTLCACAVAAGCAGAPSRQPPAASLQGDQLLASALTTWAVNNDLPEALRLAAQAAAPRSSTAPEVWMGLRLCTLSPRCDAQPFEARLKRVAPDNGAVWLSVLARAQAQGDAQAQEQILEAMAQARRFEFYWNALASRIALALHASRPRPEGKPVGAPLAAALNDASGWLSRLMLPALQPLNVACSAQAMSQTPRRERCAAIAQVLQRGDTYAAQGLGLSLQERLGGQAAETAQAQIARLGYQNRSAGSVMRVHLEPDKFAAEVIELQQRLPREQDVSLAILRWAGMTPAEVGP